MRLFPRPRPHERADQEKRNAVEFAWRVHGAQEAWTGKVDTKASILLALEGGSLFAILAANAERGALRSLAGVAAAFEIVGTALLLAGALCSAAAVFPLLGRVRGHKATYRHHLVYFGHLRHWSPDELTTALRGSAEPDELAMLSRQLIAMSKRNWFKHRCVQLSLAAALSGIGLVGVSVALPST